MGRRRRRTLEDKWCCLNQSMYHFYAFLSKLENFLVSTIKISFPRKIQVKRHRPGLRFVLFNHQAIQKSQTNEPQPSPLLDEYDKLSSFFSDVIWNWVPRHLNRAAHKAAAIGARAVQLDCWAVRPPPSLVGVLVSDGLPCPPVEVSAQ